MAEETGCNFGADYGGWKKSAEANIHVQEDQVSNFSYMRDFRVQVSLPCFGTKCEAP